MYDRGWRVAVVLLAISTALAGCSHPSQLPSGVAAYGVIPAPSTEQAVQDYHIGPLDKINITVFGEEDLSLDDVQVDAAGNILLPLVGKVQAGGKTANELSVEVANRLSEQYLKNPQVSVIVSSSVSQKVIVEGSVNEAGVFEIRGQTTLLEALAMAKGVSRVADLKQVVVFRDIKGQREGALFDVSAITKGEANDPAILGNDVVVVGVSHVKAAWRDFLTTAPLIAVFRPFG
jgi:polysaccharide export outer membrane protein